jgi:hypothetical protein
MVPVRGNWKLAVALNTNPGADGLHAPVRTAPALFVFQRIFPPKSVFAHFDRKESSKPIEQNNRGVTGTYPVIKIVLQVVIVFVGPVHQMNAAAHCSGHWSVTRPLFRALPRNASVPPEGPSVRCTSRKCTGSGGNVTSALCGVHQHCSRVRGAGSARTAGAFCWRRHGVEEQ